MNIAVIFAGGTGQRMNTVSRPKQFLELHGKPILVYTLEHFEQHPKIDVIVLVCIASWIDYARNLVQRFSLTKVQIIVPGGNSGQESIFNGIKACHEHYPEDSVILIHDGVRPLIDEKIIGDCIECTLEHGSAVTVSPAIETVVLKTEDGKVGEIIQRSRCENARAPQCFRLKDIWQAHRKAISEGLLDFVDSASLMQHYGHEIFTVRGPDENIKITTPSDFYTFRALMDAREDRQILGV